MVNTGDVLVELEVGLIADEVRANDLAEESKVGFERGLELDKLCVVELPEPLV